MGDGEAAQVALVAPVRTRHVPFDAANLSAARNAGIAAASGEVIAFIDDDATAEPTWLEHLTRPFLDDAVAATGGFVRGRNGISFQWRARSIDRDGFHRDIDVPGDAPFVPAVPTGAAVRTEGTNMAVRRSALFRVGGFDEALRFYLDDADLNMRLAEHGLETRICPRAEVHHATAASGQRRKDRVPISLKDIGASLAVYLSKYAGVGAGAALDAHRASERNRALRHMVAGRLAPGAVDQLLSSFDTGFEEGRGRIPAIPAIGPPDLPFLAAISVVSPPTHKVFAGRPWQRARLEQLARAARASGAVVTLYRFSPSALFHHVRFTDSGIWLQTGGLFGRSDRNTPLIRRALFSSRVAEETARVAEVRQSAYLETGKMSKKAEI